MFMLLLVVSFLCGVLEQICAATRFHEVFLLHVPLHDLASTEGSLSSLDMEQSKTAASSSIRLVKTASRRFLP